MPTYQENICPVCCSEQYSFLGAPKTSPSKIIAPKNSTIVKCKECCAIFANPLPTWLKDDFELLYDKSYFGTQVNSHQKKWLEERRVKVPQYRFDYIKKYLRSNNRNMLEVGAGISAFMSRYLKSSNWNVTAQEPSLDFYKQLLLNKLSITLVNEDFLKIDTSKKFSLIFADSVFEHISNPNDYFQKASLLLEPGGILYFISPNEHSLVNFIYSKMNRAINKPVRYLCPYTGSYHLIGYSKKAVDILAKNHGLELVAHIKKHDYWWFHCIHSSKVPFLFRYPLAVILLVIDRAGFGTNQEFILRKNL